MRRRSSFKGIALSCCSVGHSHCSQPGPMHHSIGGSDDTATNQSARVLGRSAPIEAAVMLAGACFRQLLQRQDLVSAPGSAAGRPRSANQPAWQRCYDSSASRKSMPPGPSMLVGERASSPGPRREDNCIPMAAVSSFNLLARFCQVCYDPQFIRQIGGIGCADANKDKEDEEGAVKTFNLSMPSQSITTPRPRSASDRHRPCRSCSLASTPATCEGDPRRLALAPLCPLHRWRQWFNRVDYLGLALALAEPSRNRALPYKPR